MKWFLILFGVVYLMVIVFDIREMQRSFRELNSSDVSAYVFTLLKDANAKDQDLDEHLQQRTDLLLVANILHKANRENCIAILSRIAARQSATFTGMILSFIGAVFIIGKLTERIPDDVGIESSK